MPKYTPPAGGGRLPPPSHRAPKGGKGKSSSSVTGPVKGLVYSIAAGVVLTVGGVGAFLAHGYGAF